MSEPSKVASEMIHSFQPSEEVQFNFSDAADDTDHGYTLDISIGSTKDYKRYEALDKLTETMQLKKVPMPDPAQPRLSDVNMSIRIAPGNRSELLKLMASKSEIFEALRGRLLIVY